MYERRGDFTSRAMSRLAIVRSFRRGPTTAGLIGPEHPVDFRIGEGIRRHSAIGAGVPPLAGDVSYQGEGRPHGSGTEADPRTSRHRCVAAAPLGGRSVAETGPKRGSAHEGIGATILTVDTLPSRSDVNVSIAEESSGIGELAGRLHLEMSTMMRGEEGVRGFEARAPSS